MEEKQKRRSIAEVAALKEQARQMEAEGKSRKEIGFTLRLSPSQVTRALGAIRPWRDRRKAA